MILSYHHKIFSSIILLTILLFTLKVKGQNTVPETITAPYNNYFQSAIQEKIYVHTDKSVYLPGEIAWFKLYIVDADHHVLMDLSKIAYTELLDSNNYPVLQGKIALEKGEGNGSFLLPVNLASGNYRFRAYTNWMKNFSPDFYFRKLITIINPKDLYAGSQAQARNQYNISFFPEGGNMINSIPGRVAFKGTDANGRGTDFTGYIVNERNDTAATFHPLKFGIGNFIFSPSSIHNYRAVINFPGGNTVIKDLPVSAAGYAIKLDHENNQLKVSVRSTESGAVYLIAHNGSSIKIAKSATLDNGAAKFMISPDQLSPGITELTLFNADKKPVSERLYFSYPLNKLKLDVQSDKPIYDPRKKIDLQLTSNTESDKLVPASMSIAVYRLDSLQQTDAMDISNYLWLSSDIPGRIESPGYYFTSNMDSVREEAMDNLMLTEGWRRFRWENNPSGTKPSFTYAPEYYGHQVMGKITDSRTNKPAADITAYLSVPGTHGLFQNANSDSLGIVRFEMKNFYGGEIIAQTNSITDSIYNIEINSPFSNNYFQSKLLPFTAPEKSPSTLLEHSMSAQVQHIYTSDRQNNFDPLSIRDTLPFYQKPDLRYLLDNYTRFTSMEELFREFVRNVFVSKSRGKFHLAMYQEESGTTFDGSPLVILDGVPVFNTEKLMKYDPLNVRTMDVIAHKYYLGNSMYEGVLNIITYDGKMKDYELDRNAIVMDYDGLQMQREFYAPDYSTPALAASHLPDYRNLLYWSGSIKTDGTGKQKIGFYSSDLPGKYAVVLQGITADGRSGSSTITFDVKAPN